MAGVGGKGAIPLIHWLPIQRPGTELPPCSGDVFSLVSNWYHLLSEWHHRSHGRGDGDQMVKRWWQATSERTSLHLQSMWFSFGPSLILSIRSSGFLPSLLSLSEYFFYCLCVPIQLPKSESIAFTSTHTSCMVVMIDLQDQLTFRRIDRLIWPQKIVLWFLVKWLVVALTSN